ncbi:MAG TPA: von Willebrand factor type A domain-containing protein [Myxococcales bacterium]|nr:von Willebrand factor type A domain-containing protein [Myxococcales bacterium]
MGRTAIVAAVLCGLVCSCEREKAMPAPAPLSFPAPAPAPAKPPAPAPAAAPAPQAPEPTAEKAAPARVDHPKASPSLQGLLGSAKTGDAKGFGGLGLKGTGSGGGGTGASMGIGEGQTIGLGRIGTVGHGAGSASGSASYGAGASYPFMMRSSGASGGVDYELGGAPKGTVSTRRSLIARGPPPAADPTSSDTFHDYGVNPFTVAAEDHLSTFAADVDTASYAIARRSILSGAMPASSSVRVEEFLNYFRYTYAPPPPERPLEAHLDAAPSPFTPGRTLLRVGLQAKQLPSSERKPLHLTFLVDVSGSMSSPDRLPLAKRSLRILVDSLRDGDTVALCTYAGAVRDVLPPTGMEQKAKIYSAIEDLSAGGSTAMASGLDLAYRNAMKTLDGKSVSRVLVLTDGDANVGSSNHEEMLQQIQKYVKEGVTLTTVGFGMGNLKDETLEQLADKGNGNYHYVDSLMQARRVFHEQLGSTLEVVAQDVKLQVDFDPAKVKRYRLVGYENRAIADRDFRNDRVDAGEVGSGHTVTALYELELQPGASHEGLATVRIRAKKPRGERADEWAFPLKASAFASTFEEASPDFRFAVAVMGAAEKLRRSPEAQEWSYERILQIARAAAPADSAERQEFIQLLERSRPLIGPVASRK